MGGTALFFHRVRQYTLLWLCFLWFGLHIIALSRFPQWWGGHSYGPRLLTDVIPALILITVLMWREISPLLKPHHKIAVITGYIALGSAGVLINSYQGLYNIYTAEWLARPSIDRYPERLFEWKYPQFLATAESIQEGERAHAFKYILPKLEPYFGQIITPTSDETNQAIFLGWHPSARGLRWSAVPTATLILKSGQLNIKNKLIIMEFSASSQEAQKVNVILNNTPIGSLIFSGLGWESYLLAFDPTLLKENGSNQIDFQILDATKETSWHNWRQFWLLLRSNHQIQQINFDANSFFYYIQYFLEQYLLYVVAIVISPATRFVEFDPWKGVSIDPQLQASSPAEIKEGNSSIRVNQNDELKIEGVLWSVNRQEVQTELEIAPETISPDNPLTLEIVIKNESGTHTIHEPLNRLTPIIFTGILESGQNIFGFKVLAKKNGEGQELHLRQITLKRPELS